MLHVLGMTWRFWACHSYIPWARVESCENVYGHSCDLWLEHYVHLFYGDDGIDPRALLLTTPPGPSQMCSLWILWGSCKATCHFSCYLDHCMLVASATSKAFIFISCVSLEVGVVMALLGFIFWLQILFSRLFSPS